ncbi:MAG: hypothetical protein MJA27_02835 [Pseudanabaenales cyanobacterium]|nr:hypothetical protein [Pseudanabaenales cyanobacterium]
MTKAIFCELGVWSKARKPCQYIQLQDLVMTAKEALLPELEDAAESLIAEVLDFLRYLKLRRLEDEADIANARAALTEIETEETISWDTLKIYQ